MKRKTLVLLTIISFLLLATLGTSVALFSALKNGSGLVSIRSGDINFKYTEVSGIGNGINLDISDVISDSEGKVLDNYFDFKIESNLIGSDMVYEVSIEPLINTTINLSGLKIYITELVDGGEREISSNFNGLGKVKYLTDYENYVIYQERIIKNTKNYEKNFRVRMWIGEDVNIYTNEYMGTSGSFRVNVNSKSDYSMVDASIPTPVITGGTGMIWTTELQTISLVPTTPAIGGVTYEYYVADDSDDIPNDLTIATGTTMDSYNVIRIGQNYIYYRAVTSDNLKSSWSNPEIVYYDNTEYSITYVLNGGTQVENPIISYNVETPSFDLLEPTYQGYVFEGWHTTSDFTGSVVTRINKGSRGNKTYYAKWTPNTYTVKFNANGGTGSMNDQTLTYDSSIALITNTFTKTGYAFIGWSIDSNASIATYVDGEYVSNLSTEGTVILYAVWTEAIATTNNSFYADLQSAIDKVGSTSQTVTLLKNTAENIVISQNKNVVLDLSNHKLSNTDNATVATVINYGTLVVYDGEVFSNTFNTIDNYGVLSLSDRAVITGSASGYPTLYNQSTGTVSISDSEVSSTTSNTINNSGILNISETAVITGSASGYPTLYNKSTGNVTISGGELSSTISNTISNAGTLNISETTVITGSGNYPPLYNQSSGNVTITGGRLSSSNSNTINNSGTLNISETAVITGSDNYPTLYNQSSGNVTITGGRLSSSTSNTISNYGTLNISGTSFVEGSASKYPTLYNQSSGTVLLEGGEIRNTGGGYAVYNNGGSATNNGAIITGKKYGL